VLSFTKRGIDSIFTYNSDRAEAEKVVSLVAEAGQKAVALQLDIGNVSAFDDFVENVRQVLGGLGTERFDYLVNNAGISHHTACPSRAAPWGACGRRSCPGRARVTLPAGTSVSTALRKRIYH
jgi:NAD(P)-dependent dehydrogenase (short-subunit alcohol dehydrogenase family)